MEGCDESLPVAEPVLGYQQRVRRNHGPQEVSKLNVHRRAVVQRANANILEMPRRLRRSLRKKIREVRMQVAGRADGAARTRHSHDIGGPGGISTEKSVENRRYQNGAASV